MNRNAKKLSRILLVATLFVTVSARSLSGPEAQAPRSSIADRPPAAATPATAPSSAKPTPTSTTPAPTTLASSGSEKQKTSQTKHAGMDSVNPETGVNRKQGTRWYRKTKPGKLQPDAIQAGYQAAR